MKNSWRSKWNWFKIPFKFKLKLKQKAKCQQSSKKLKTEETKRHTEGLTDSCRDLTEGKHQHHVLSLDECRQCRAHKKREGNCQHQSSEKLVEDHCVDDTGIDISSFQQKQTVDNTDDVSSLQLNSGLLESQGDIGEDLTVDWKSGDTLSTTGNNLYHHGCYWTESDIELLGSSLTLTSFNEDMENCMSDFPDDDGPLKSSNLCTIHCLDDSGLQYRPDFTKSGLYACLRRDKYYCFSCTPLKTSSLDLFTCNSYLVDALDLSGPSRHWPFTTQNEDKIQPSKRSCSNYFQYEDTSHPSTPSCTAKSPNEKMTLATKPACSDYTRNEEMTQASKLDSFFDNSQDEDTAHDQPSKPFYCSDYTQDEEMTAASKSDYTEDDEMTEASKPSHSDCTEDDKMSAASKPSHSDYTEDDEMTEASKPSCSDDSLDDKMSAASKPACSDYTEDDEMTEASKPSCSDDSLDDKMFAASKHACSDYTEDDELTEALKPSCSDDSLDDKMSAASKPVCSDYTEDDELTEALKPSCSDDSLDDKMSAASKPACSDYTEDDEMTEASKPSCSDDSLDDKMSAASKPACSDYTEDDELTEASKPSCSDDSLDDKMSAASKPACSDYTEDDELTEALKPSCSDDSLDDKMSAASKPACSDYTEDDEMTEASKPSCSDDTLDDKMSAASKPACSGYTQDEEMTEASKPSCSDDSLDDKMSAASKHACFDYTMDKDTCTQHSKPSRSDNMIQDKDKGLRAQKNCLPNSRSYKQKSKNKIQPIIYRKRKRTYEKVKYRREADHVFQKTQLRQKVFLENLKEHIRQKAHVFHRKSCQGIRTARRKAHQSDMKFVKSTGRLDRKLHGLYEKGLRSLQTWEHRHAFCDGLGSNCSSKKAENKKRKKSFIFHRSILKNHSKSFHILKMNYTADVLCRYFLKYHLKRKTNLIQMGVCKRKIIGKEISEISDHEKNTENNKRKRVSEAYNDFQESEENIWQAKSKAYKQLRQSKERPTDTTSIISQHLSTDGGRPGGKPDTFKSHVYQPRCEQVRRSAPCNPQQPSQPAVVQMGERNSPRDMVAGSATQSMTIQSSEQRVVPSTSLFQNLLTNLPSAGQFEFCGKKLQLRCICQVACILATIICFNSAFPLFEDNLRNANRNFRWLYHICRKCKAGRFFEAIKRFWLKHGKDYFGNKSFISFKIKLEADWILEPLGIKVIEKRSKCTNKSCTFRQRGKPDSDKFSSSIREFSRRSFCLRDPNPLRKFPRFQSLFDEWQAEDVCCVCMNGTIRVTRMLDDTQGPPPPLLPIPTFFQEGNIEIPLPVLLNHYKTDRQPEEVKIGNQRYRLGALSYAIRKCTDDGFDEYLHERCQIWDDTLGKWVYFDVEGWNELGGEKLKMSPDETPGKSFRVAYFTRIDD